VKLTAPSLVCQQAVELMSDYLEGALSRRDRRRLEKHLAGCPHCTTYLEQMRLTIAASGVVGPDDLEPDALEGLVEIFRRFHDEPDQR
jgi:anti-sigma factor RsiW